MIVPRVYSNYVVEANQLLGHLIQLNRKKKNWTMKELGDRAGISRATLQKIEDGEMTVAIGLVFEVASLVGVSLFEMDKTKLTKQREQLLEVLTLLPKTIHSSQKVIDDEF